MNGCKSARRRIRVQLPRMDGIDEKTIYEDEDVFARKHYTRIAQPPVVCTGVENKLTV